MASSRPGGGPQTPLSSFSRTERVVMVETAEIRDSDEEPEASESVDRDESDDREI
jgi:hypothetical protein